MTTLYFAESLRELVGGVDAVLSDIWGVVHNGLESFPEACEALHTYRSRGGTVILITNAPRPADSVQRQLRKLGVADETYDAIVSSGDLTRLYVAEHPGRKMFWLGPERDNSIYRGLDAKTAPLEEADYIVCTGLYDDETETAEDYRGKLHRPIYERAMALAGERQGHPIDRKKVLASGDSVRTDLTGAREFGIDCLFVTRGILAEEFEGLDQLDPASVLELFGHPPKALMRELKW